MRAIRYSGDDSYGSLTSLSRHSSLSPAHTVNGQTVGTSSTNPASAAPLDSDFPSLGGRSLSYNVAATQLVSYATQAGNVLPSAAASASLSPDDFPVLGQQNSFGSFAPGLDSIMRRTPGSTAVGYDVKPSPAKSQLPPPGAPSSTNSSASAPWLPNGLGSAQQSSSASGSLSNGQGYPGLSMLDGRRTGQANPSPAMNGPGSAASRPLPPPALPTTSAGSASGSANGSVSGPPPGQPSTPASQVLYSPADRFGLLGLLHIIKTSDPDVMTLALGSDLSKLGLDLGRRENLAPSLLTPWTDSDRASQLNIEPDYHLPSCYNVQPPPAHTKVSQFSDETLFWIFYTHPRDLMQEAAAQELYKHNWRYHKECHLWLTKESGIEPSQKTADYERGSYIFFDPNTWEKVKREFVLVYSELESRPAQSQALQAALQAAGGPQ